MLFDLDSLKGKKKVRPQLKKAITPTATVNIKYMF